MIIKNVCNILSKNISEVKKLRKGWYFGVSNIGIEEMHMKVSLKKFIEKNNYNEHMDI